MQECLQKLIQAKPIVKKRQQGNLGAYLEGSELTSSFEEFSWELQIQDNVTVTKRNKER